MAILKVRNRQINKFSAPSGFIKPDLLLLYIFVQLARKGPMKSNVHVFTLF